MRDDDGKFIKYSGVIFEVLTQISHKLNFTYSVHEPPDGKYGNEQSDGSYNGMIKQVRGKMWVSLCLILKRPVLVVATTHKTCLKKYI